jgi:hypothetical protein
MDPLSFTVMVSRAARGEGAETEKRRRHAEEYYILSLKWRETSSIMSYVYDM